MPDRPRVLDAAVEADRLAWVERWSAWPEREPTAHPAYVSLMARPCDRALCAVAGDPGAGILFPFVLRPLSAEPWARLGEDRWDAVTPYGYGGPFAWGAAGELANALWDHLERWHRDQRVVSTFARLSLFPGQLAPFRGEVAEAASNVVRRLDLPPEDLWRSYAHKVRKNVNAARRAGLEFELDPEGRHLEEFLAIYRTTMDRRSAAGGYYFPRSFFETIVRELAGSYFFAHVRSGGRIVSTELVLRSASHLYSFLGGTLAEAFQLRPNDLLKHEVATWGGAQGLRAYVLGGGYQALDGIYQYKLAFAPDGVVPFFVGRAIHDPTGYRDLLDARRAASPDGAWEPRSAFFPAYRS